MDFTSIAIVAFTLSVVVIISDFFANRRSNKPRSEGNRNLIELAYYAALIAGFGLLVILKVMTFEGVLLSATVLTGCVCAWNYWVAAKKRTAEKSEPIFVEISRGFFPIILVVLLLRSFLVEPFKIPSGSMIPSLLVGDFILVNKYTYGIRLPVLHNKVVSMNDPKRGDVMVFRYPEDPTVDYIKRVIGVPGDRVEYRNKQLTVNGKQVALKRNGDYSVSDASLNSYKHELYTEQLADVAHKIIVNPDAPSVLLPQVHQFANKENCSYNDDGFVCKVPAGHYFMMGDNRDGSADSRYWGFVPEGNIVGRAFFIWWNFGDFKRIGTKII